MQQLRLQGQPASGRPSRLSHLTGSDIILLTGNPSDKLKLILHFRKPLSIAVLTFSQRCEDLKRERVAIEKEFSDLNPSQS